MSLKQRGLVRTGELELRHHQGGWSVEFESPRDMQEYLEQKNIDSWIVFDRKV